MAPTAIKGASGRRTKIRAWVSDAGTCLGRLMHLSMPSAYLNGRGEMYNIRQSPVSLRAGFPAVSPEGATSMDPMHQTKVHASR